MRYIILLLVVELLGGCYSNPVCLISPDTGKTIECGLYRSIGLFDLPLRMNEFACVSDYKAKGYLPVDKKYCTHPE
jgi:hypothetical protein